MADPTSAQEQRDQMQQQVQGQTGYGSGSDDFAQPGKTGNNENGASQGQDAAVDMNDDGDVEQASQAGYGSNPQSGGMNDDPNSTPAIGGSQSNSDPQMDQDEAMIDDEDMDGANASSAGGGM